MNRYIIAIVILFVCIITAYIYSNKRIEPFVNTNNTLCIYVIYEKNDQYKENISYFMKNGILSNVDYIFVVNGSLTVELPTGSNIKHLFRENKGYDFGAWGEALRNTNLDPYKYFVFINTSVRGPYKKYCGENWISELTKYITNDVKLVGSTINIHDQPVKPHIQSMVFATDRDGLNVLVEKGIFDEVPENYSFRDLIHNREIGMSQKILEHGWNITCLAKKYQNIDYRTIKKDINPTSANGDCHFPNRYFGSTLDKNEILFIKTERIPPETL